MAKITFGAIVADARGSISGNTFSRNANGAYIRTRVSGINSSTTAQQLVRSRFSSISRLWKDLTEAETETWIAAASQFTQSDALGQATTLTAMQLFSARNNSLVQVGLPPIRAYASSTVAPAPYTVELILSLDPASPGVVQMEANRSDDTEWGIPGTVLVFEATRPMSAGVYRPKRNDFRQIAVMSGQSIEVISLELGAFYGPVLGTANAGQKIALRSSYVDIVSGERSTPVVVLATIPG